MLRNETKKICGSCPQSLTRTARSPNGPKRISPHSKSKWHFCFLFRSFHILLSTRKADAMTESFCVVPLHLAEWQYIILSSSFPTTSVEGIRARDEFWQELFAFLLPERHRKQRVNTSSIIECIFLDAIIENFLHDSGRTLVCAEYGYAKGSANINS
jgi:hypothetical protein